LKRQSVPSFQKKRKPRFVSLWSEQESATLSLEKKTRCVEDVTGSVGALVGEEVDVDVVVVWVGEVADGGEEFASCEGELQEERRSTLNRSGATDI
jgi:hypothetical protein